MSCLLANIGADTYALHETRFSKCGGHHIAAGGCKLHEPVARTLGLDAGDARGDVVKLLARFRVIGNFKVVRFYPILNFGHFWAALLKMSGFTPY